MARRSSIPPRSAPSELEESFIFFKSLGYSFPNKKPTARPLSGLFGFVPFWGHLSLLRLGFLTPPEMEPSKIVAWLGKR